MHKAALLPTVFGLLMLGGCRFKGGESFASATTPNPVKTSDWKDPYASGGLGDATGGLQPKTRYSVGAKTTGTGSVDASYNQPAYGTGNQPGENTGHSASVLGRTNAPAQQDPPGAYQSAAGRTTRG